MKTFKINVDIGLKNLNLENVIQTDVPKYHNKKLKN
jgi:hypothetical protein